MKPYAYSASGTATAANGSDVAIIGTWKVQLNVPGYNEQLTCYVADVNTVIDIILGEDWIRSHEGVLD